MVLGDCWTKLSWFYYQYQLVTGLYMLEPWERTTFSSLVIAVAGVAVYYTQALHYAQRMLSCLNELIWKDWLWFPEGMGWADMKDHDDKIFPKAGDLWLTIPIAVMLVLSRPIFEKMITRPLGGRLGVKDKQRVRVNPNPAFESSFRSSKHPSQSDLESLSKLTGWSVRQIQRWFRKRRNQDHPNKLKKFCEASWRFTFYFVSFFAGLAVMYDKPWFLTSPDFIDYWNGYPKFPLLPSQYWYYMIEMGFYMSLVFTAAWDVKRKDFKEMQVHHVATICLMTFSWLVNYVRLGTLVMLVHDASDFMLESAKMCVYSGWRRTSDFIFIIFASTFIFSRLVIFPFWIIHMTLIKPLTLYKPFFGFCFFNGLLVLLQFLNIYWSFHLLAAAKRFLSGSHVEDERSDEEAETESGDEDEGKRETS